MIWISILSAIVFVLLALRRRKNKKVGLITILMEFSVFVETMQHNTSPDYDYAFKVIFEMYYLHTKQLLIRI